MSKEADVFRRPSVLIESPAKCITHTDVLPSPLVSNHNTPCVMSQSMRMSSVSLQDTRLLGTKNSSPRLLSGKTSSIWGRLCFRGTWALKVCGWQHHLCRGWMIWTFECCRGHASVIIGKHTHPLMHHQNHQILGFYLAFCDYICDTSRNLVAYLNFTHCLISWSWQWK